MDQQMSCVKPRSESSFTVVTGSTVTNHQCRMSSRYDFIINQIRVHPPTRRVRFNTTCVVAFQNKNTPLDNRGAQGWREEIVDPTKRTISSSDQNKVYS